jgi:P27 family predicted phage terminase small subunit
MSARKANPTGKDTRRLDADPYAKGLLTSIPPAPKGLKAHGKRAWQQAVGFLVPAKLATSGDLAILERYARTVDMACDLEDAIARNGLLTETGAVNPAATMLVRVNGTLKALAVNLHLTPYSRAALTREVRLADADGMAGEDKSGSPIAAALKAVN